MFLAWPFVNLSSKQTGYLTNCSQTKFLKIILVLESFLLDRFFDWPIWLFGQTGCAHAHRTLSGRAALLELYAFLVSKYAIHGNCSEETISGYEGQSLVLKVWLSQSSPTLLNHPSNLLHPGDLDPQHVQLSRNPTPSCLPPSLSTPRRPHRPNASTLRSQLATTEANRWPVVWEKFARHLLVMFIKKMQLKVTGEDFVLSP